MVGTSSTNPRSVKLFKKAQRYLVGGVNSPVRAYKSVGGTPLVIARAKGSQIVDVDGNEYIDYVGSWGALILGSAEPTVVEEVRRAVESGTSFGALCEAEIELAETIKNSMPSLEMIRFVNSGTEACMSATRLARAFTKRKKILKFEGAYHGHADLFLSQSGSGMASLGLPKSDGVPRAVVRDTLTAGYNDLMEVRRMFKMHEIAAVIVEPISGNMGVIPPDKGFLHELRDLTERNGSILVFDEVITGFRVSRGGAQELYGIIPDLTCLGKIIGGGFPVGAFGGREDIMKLLAPIGRVYQAGTLSGNPVTMKAGLATLHRLDKGTYSRLERKASHLGSSLGRLSHRVKVNRVGSMLSIHFTDKIVTNYPSASSCDKDLYARYFHHMQSRGVYLPPSHMEAFFVSDAHSMKDIDHTIMSADSALNSFYRN
ncbi:MAG: glutamate-1-semialdehyde 2,1-aminomutase [Thaumarchaeota archaeon]|nr:glutamate-1-semialdehyde 2,1-aminomutase [Nitrososphaerota archaeon]